jgi:hypothetical protein
VQFPPTTLIRLYELLKNSRLTWQMPDQHQSSLSPGCFDVESLDKVFGGG